MYAGTMRQLTFSHGTTFKMYKKKKCKQPLLTHDNVKLDSIAHTVCTHKNCVQSLQQSKDSPKRCVRVSGICLLCKVQMAKNTWLALKGCPHSCIPFQNMPQGFFFNKKWTSWDPQAMVKLIPEPTTISFILMDPPFHDKYTITMFSWGL